MPKSIPFAIVLQEQLKDPEQFLVDLKTAFLENDPELFDVALQDGINAQGHNIILRPVLNKLAESLQRHGVGKEVLTAVLDDI
jgi:hypothetical protein